jgi:hypothetical protein
VNKRTKWLLSIGVIATLVVGFQVAAYASHGLATLAFSNFEIDEDANLKNDDGAPFVDWADLAHPNGPELRATDAATGQNDDSYKGGVKEDTECPGEVTGSIPNNKSDLLTFHLYEEPGNTDNPQGYLNLAWSRVSDPSGTTLMDFEFNQNSLEEDGCPNSPNVARTDGDLLIEYAIDQGGARAEITGRFWDDTTNAWGPVVDLTEPSALCPDGDPANDVVVGEDIGPCATGTINTSVIPTTEADGLPLSPKQARTFGEAQIDLRLIFNEGECATFGTAMLKSRSSDSFTSQLKDFIEPLDIELSNCGRVIIHKDTNPETNPTTGPEFTFAETITTDPAQEDDDTTPGFDESTNFKLRDNGTNEIVNVVPGDGLTVSETGLPTAWQFDSVDCTSAQPGIADPAAFEGTIQPVSVSATGLITFNIAGADDVLECTYINEQNVTTLDTDPFVFPNDTATVSNTLGTPTGSVTFELYGPDTTPGVATDNCDPSVQGTADYTQTVAINASGVARTTNGDGATLPADFEINSANEGTYWWSVSFTGTGGTPDVAATCNENTVVDVTDSPGTS